MDWLITVLDWLKNSDNRTVLTFIGGGIVVVAGAIWKVYEHYDAKKTQSLEPAQPSKSTADSNTVSLPSIPKRADIPPLDAAARRSTYLRLMAKEWRTLPVEALDPNAADTTARRLNLEPVYIDLDPVTPRSGRSPDRVAGDREGPLSAVEALCQANRQRLVLLGQPGSGKSPFGPSPGRDASGGTAAARCGQLGRTSAGLDRCGPAPRVRPAAAPGRRSDRCDRGRHCRWVRLFFYDVSNPNYGLVSEPGRHSS
jgi:hypothetical protein